MTNLAHWTHDDIEALGGDFDGSLSSLCIMSLSFDFTRSALGVGASGNSLAASIGGNSNVGNQLTNSNNNSNNNNNNNNNNNISNKDNSTSQLTTALQAIQQAHSQGNNRNQVANSSSNTSGSINASSNINNVNSNNNNNNINNNSSNNHSSASSTTSTCSRGTSGSGHHDANNSSNNNSSPSHSGVSAERYSSLHHAQESSMFGPEQASKQRFQYILTAPISAATKVTEDTMTYLNQGQAYEIKLKNISDISEGKKGFMCSIINIGFHERHMQQAENELWQQWSQQHPGERIFSVDMKLSYNVFGVESDGLNKYEFLWDSSKSAGVFIRINSISTEFTLRKHGGEKGIPFKMSIETFSYNSKTHDSYFISAACCQIKVFKPKGAERKIRSDRDKFLKRPQSEQEKYHRSCDQTVFSECPLSSLHPMVDGSLSYYRHSHGHFASKQIEQSTSGTPTAASMHHNSHHLHNHNQPNSEETDGQQHTGSENNGHEQNDQEPERCEGQQQHQHQHHSSNNSESGSLETPVGANPNQRDGRNYDSSSPGHEDDEEDNCAGEGEAANETTGPGVRVHTDYSTSRLMSAHTSSFGGQHHQLQLHHRSHSLEDDHDQRIEHRQQHSTTNQEHSPDHDQEDQLQASCHQQQFGTYHHHQLTASRSVAGLTAVSHTSQPFNHHVATYYNTHTALPSVHHHHHIASHIATNPLHHLSSGLHGPHQQHHQHQPIGPNILNGRAIFSSGGGASTSSNPTGSAYHKQASLSASASLSTVNGQERDGQKSTFAFGSLASNVIPNSGATPFRASNLAISSSSVSQGSNNAFPHHQQPHHHFGSIHQITGSLSGDHHHNHHQQQLADDLRIEGASSTSQVGTAYSANDNHHNNFAEQHSMNNQQQATAQTPSSCHRQRSASTSMTTTNSNAHGNHCSSYMGSGFHHMTNGRNSESIGGYNSIGDNNPSINNNSAGNHLMTNNSNPWMMLPSNCSGNNHRSTNSVVSSSACDSRRCSANSNCTAPAANGLANQNSSNNTNTDAYCNISGGSASSYASHNNHSIQQQQPYEILGNHGQKANHHQHSSSPTSYCTKFRNISTNQNYTQYGTASSFPNSDNHYVNSHPQQHEPPGRFNFCMTNYSITVNSSCTEVASWLMANRFGLYLKTFTNFSGSDLLRLSKKELIEICDLLDGIRLYNCLHNQPIRPRRVLYICNEDSEIFHSIYLYDVTLKELLREISNIITKKYKYKSNQQHDKSLLDRSSSSDSRSSIGPQSSGDEASVADENNSINNYGTNKLTDTSHSEQDDNNDDMIVHQRYFTSHSQKSDHHSHHGSATAISNERHDNDDALTLNSTVKISSLLVQGFSSVKVVATDQVIQMLDDESTWALNLTMRKPRLCEACLTACRPTLSSPSKRINKS